MRAKDFTTNLNEKKKSVSFRDPELIRTQQFVKTHYPTYSADPEVAFEKWTQRALKHSEERDLVHDREIRDMQSDLAQIKSAIKKITTNK